MRVRDPIQGFTLLELLVTLSILAGVVSVILACFDGGLRVFTRIQDFGSHEMDLYLAGEQLERDVLGILAGGPYRLATEELAFSRRSLVGGGSQSVRYRAPLQGGLYYLEGSAAEGDTVRELQLVQTNLQVSFRFAFTNQAAGWSRDWVGSTNLPVAIQMEVEGERASMGRVARTIVLPAVEQEAAP